jgi:hypothetical protein
MTGAGTTVFGGQRGMYALNYGSGALSITANGDVTGTNDIGIFAKSGSSFFHPTGDLSVTTGAGTTVTGGVFGINAQNYGTGALNVTANGDVAGTLSAGIYARDFGGGTDLSVTTGIGTTVTSGGTGIFAKSLVGSTGALTVTANGDVTGTLGDGIFATQVASLDSQAMSLGSDEPMSVGYDDKSLAAPQSYGPSLVFWTNAFGAGQTSTATRMRRQRTAISAASSQAWTPMSQALGGSGSPPAHPSQTSRSMPGIAGQTWTASISAATPAPLPARLHCAAAGPGSGTTSTPRAR